MSGAAGSHLRSLCMVWLAADGSALLMATEDGERATCTALDRLCSTGMPEYVMSMLIDALGTQPTFSQLTLGALGTGGHVLLFFLEQQVAGDAQVMRRLDIRRL